MVKKLMMMVAALAMLMLSSVAFAASEVPVIAALSDGMSVELTDSQLEEVRAKAFDVSIYNGILHPYFFRIYVGGIYTNTAQMVQMDDYLGSSYYPTGPGGVNGYRVAGTSSGAPVSFTRNPSTGDIKIYDQKFAYWWPANTGFIWRQLSLPPGYTQLGSLLIGGNSMMRPGVYETARKELAVFYQNNSTGMVSYIADSVVFQPTNGQMISNTTYNVNLAAYSSNPFIPNSSTPHILP